MFTEFLDTSRFPGEGHQQRMAAFLADKYSTVPLDVVVALGPEALRFILGNRERTARAVPVVFCCVSAATLAGLSLPADTSGVVSEYDLRKTMHLAALLQPTARNIVVVAGATAFDKQWMATAERQLAGYAPRYTIRYLVGLPYDELLSELKALPRETIVILTSMLADGAGKVFDRPRDAAPGISAASNAPVYAPYDTYLDRGVVGGHMDSFEASGTAVADLVLRVIAGERPPVQSVITSSYRVDWRQLRRWGLSEANLPVGTTVLFKEPSLWDRHFGEIIAAAAAFLLQSAVMVFLLIEQRRRRQAERSFTESEERMAFAAAAVNVGLWQYEVASERLWATDHCRRMFGIPDGQTLTRSSFVDAVHPDDRAAGRRWMAEVGRSHGPMAGEFRVTAKEGDLRWYLCRAQTRFDAQGKAIQVSGTFSDITARKTAEAEADLQRQMLAHITRAATLGELSGALAHEINQPLTAILANAEAARRMLARDPPLLGEVGEALDDIIAEDHRAGDVIRRLRGMLKKDEGKWAAFVPSEIVGSVLRLLRGELINRRIEIRLALTDNLPEVRGDQVQIQQVLTNLLLNAMDAVAPLEVSRRVITISTGLSRSDEVETVVTDRGPGLPDGGHARVVEAFFTTKQHGLGLGLAICKSILTAHGGTLTVDNIADAPGVRASFTLPTRPAVARAA